MQKKTTYFYKEIPVENLLLNPDNARYVYTTELPDEVSSIKELLNILEPQIIALAKDIASDGLNPNELATVSPLIDDKDKYVVLDGNRRIACIKLMTKYKGHLESFGFSKRVINAFSELNTSIDTVYCVVYEEESFADSLLEKIHTSVPGIGQVKWDPLAQDKHKAKLGIITHRHAIIELLKFSHYTSPFIKSLLNNSGWFSKLDRYAKNTYVKFFGICFDENDNIQLLLEESEIIDGLSQLIYDLQSTKATDIAQTEAVRNKYLYIEFPKDKIPDSTKRNKDTVIFNVINKVMEVYENSTDSIDEKNIEKQISITEEIEKTNSGGDQTGNDNMKTGNSKQNEEANSNDTTNRDANAYDVETTSTNRNITTKQYTLIPKDSYINISDIRTRELFEELQKLNVYLFKNTVSIALRSLIEFSVDCFLLSRQSKASAMPDNSNVTLIEKIEKVYSLLEGIYGNDILKHSMPAIQIEIQNYRDNKKNHNTIKLLNLCVHHSNYYPDSEQLKTIYRNVEPYIKLIWENIK